MNNFDIPLDKDKDFTHSYGGGCIISTCNKCKKDIGAEEVDFPGTKEQQEEPRKKLKEKEEKHLKEFIIK